MRATLRITWLLLSLSFLFYSVCSETKAPDSVPDVTPTAAVITTAGAQALTTSKQTNNEALPTISGVGKENNPAQPSQTTAVATEATIRTTPMVVPASSQTQATTATNNPPQQTTNAPGDSQSAKDVSTPTAPSNVQPSLTPAAATDGSHSTELSTGATTAQINAASTPGKATEAPATTPGNPPTVGAVETTVVPTTVPAGEQVASTHISITSTMSQGDSNQATQKESKESQETTSLRPTKPAGIPETTSSPSSQTQTRAPAVGTADSRAGTTPLETTTTPKATTTTTTTASTTPPQPKKFVYSLLSRQETKEERDLAEVCKRLMPNWENGTCTLTWRHHNGKIQFDCVEINGKVQTSLAAQYYEEITKKPTDNKTLIAILASCGALLIMIVILAVCASHHRKPYNENQQHLTEELHTVENGYHDNPTLEVMEVQPEMQEKKVALNGEFNDSWIVPIDNLLKEDIPDEEDTHL